MTLRIGLAPARRAPATVPFACERLPVHGPGTYRFADFIEVGASQSAIVLAWLVPRFRPL